MSNFIGTFSKNSNTKFRQNLSNFIGTFSKNSNTKFLQNLSNFIGTFSKKYSNTKFRQNLSNFIGTFSKKILKYKISSKSVEFYRHIFEKNTHIQNFVKICRILSAHFRKKYSDIKFRQSLSNFIGTFSKKKLKYRISSKSVEFYRHIFEKKNTHI